MTKSWYYPVAGFVVVLIFAPTFTGGFLADDFVYVYKLHDRPWASWPVLFIREWSEGIWGFELKELRPFSALSYMVDGRIWGAQAGGYRLTNLLLHAGTTMLVMHMAATLSGGRALAAVVAGSVFAFHPVAVEPALWIAGRTDILATGCALVFWFGAERFVRGGVGMNLAVATAGYLTSAFSKEYGLAIPLLVIFKWLTLEPKATAQTWKRRGIVILLALVALAVYTVCRLLAFGSNATGSGTGWYDPAVWQRQISYAGWLAPVLPFAATGEWVARFPVALIKVAWAFGVVGIAAATIYCIRTRRDPWARLLFFGLGWPLFACSLLLVVHYFSPRHLYFGLVGLAIGAGISISLIQSRVTRVLVAAALAVWIAAAHWVTLKPWKEAGRISAEALQTLQELGEAAPLGSIVVLSVHGRVDSALLWPWVSPYVAGRPFVSPGFAPENVLENPGNYYQPDNWPADRMRTAIDRLRNAPAAVVLFVGTDSRVVSRFVPASILHAALPSLVDVAEDGIETWEWVEWVQQLAEGDSIRSGR